MRSFRFASARLSRGSWSATQSGASSVGPSEHVGGKIDRRVFAEGPARRQSARRPSHIGPLFSPDKPSCRVLNRPWGKKVPGIGRRSGSKPPLLVNRAQRWLGRGAGKTQESSASKVPALHREAERDTTGSISRQHPVHTWIGACVQGKPRSAATLIPFRVSVIKARLTLWF